MTPLEEQKLAKLKNIMINHFVDYGLSEEESDEAYNDFAKSTSLEAILEKYKKHEQKYLENFLSKSDYGKTKI